MHAGIRIFDPILFEDTVVSKIMEDFKGQLQRFHKLSLFDRFRHVENGFDINF